MRPWHQPRSSARLMPSDPSLQSRTEARPPQLLGHKNRQVKAKTHTGQVMYTARPGCGCSHQMQHQPKASTAQRPTTPSACLSLIQAHSTSPYCRLGTPNTWHGSGQQERCLMHAGNAAAGSACASWRIKQRGTGQTPRGSVHSGPHLHVCHGGMAVQELLHLPRVDVFPARGTIRFMCKIV